MASGGDKVEKSVNSIIPETWVSLDSGFFGENIIVLSFQVPCDLSKTRLVIDLIAKSWCIHDSQSNSCAFLLEIFHQHRKKM